MSAVGHVRIASLDLIRGVAVLGILAVNITGFAGPIAATTSPHLPTAGSTADEIAFAVMFLLFEGKMRALLALLFGASMMLFIERTEAHDRDGDMLQLRRLCWLALFGYLHYLLFWWGDILFTYALAGSVALALRSMPIRQMIATALLIFLCWHGLEAVQNAESVATEESVRLSTATEDQAKAYTDANVLRRDRMDQEEALYRSGFRRQIAAKFEREPFWPFGVAMMSIGEILPLMLLGMVLCQTGFFSGAWPENTLKWMAIGGIGLGGLATAGILTWAWQRHFPPNAMLAAFTSWTALPHLAMALGYAAALMLAMPHILTTALGKRIEATGRMAFSNYIGTTVVMTAIFYGWGLGLIGRVSPSVEPLFVLFGWFLMLTWSKPWLAKFTMGPLEWLWRSLTEWRVMPLEKRIAIAIHSH